MAKSVFEVTSKITGKTIRLEAEYHAYMGRKIADADGIKVDIGPEVKITSEMVAFVNGAKYDTCRDENFWRLIDVDKPMHGKKSGACKSVLVNRKMQQIMKNGSPSLSKQARMPM